MLQSDREMENRKEWLRDMENKTSTCNIPPVILPKGEKKRVGEIIKKL